MNDQTPKSQVPPYYSWKTFGTYIQSLRQSMPARIDTSGMIRLAGGMRQPMLNSLKFLKLIQEDGTSEPILRKLVDATQPEKREAYSLVLKEVLKTAYPSLFAEDFDLATTTPAQLRAKIEELGVSGDTARKAETYFLDAAKDAGIKISPVVLESRKKGPKAGGASVKPKGKRRDSQSETSDASAHAEVDPIKQAMLDKLPEFNPEWDPKVQEKWFEMFARVFGKIEEQ